MRYSFRSIIFLRLLLAASVLWLFTSCETTGDPWVDDIGFSPEKAQRRLDEKQRELAMWQSWALDERIRMSGLRRDLNRAKREKAADAATLSTLENKIGRARADLSELEAEVATLSAQHAFSVSLQNRRDRLQAEVDALDLKLSTMLKHHYLPQE